MPAGQGEDAERFAAAVEQGTPPGFAGDDDLARELAIVAMLRSAGPALAPDPGAKARAKQRLMALVAEQGEQHLSAARRPAAPAPQETTAPVGRVPEPSFPSPRTEQGHPEQGRVERNAVTDTEKLAPVRSGEPPAGETRDGATAPRTLSPSPSSGGSRRARHSVANRPAGRDASSRRPAPRLRRRVAVVSAAALVVMIALTGGGLMASRDALPGDSLYGVKRAAEAAELAFTFDETARAQRQLQLAATRLLEVEQLVARGGQQADPEVYTAAIQEFDAATGEGSRVLLSAAEADGGTAELGSLQTWVSEQSNRLTELRPALPQPAADDADGSIQLLDLLLGRVETLGARSGDPREVNLQGPDGSEPDVTETPTSPGASEGPAPDQRLTPPGTEVPSESTEPSDQEGGPLIEVPDLLPDGSPQPEGNSGSEEEGEGAPSDESDTPPPPSEGSEGGDVPLLPPVTLPPLLPGLPPITIG